MNDFKPNTRSELKRCKLTGLRFTSEQFPYKNRHNENKSRLGVLFQNVSQRAVNGRGAALRAKHYPDNSHHVKGVSMDPRWVNDPALFAIEIMVAIGCPVANENGERLSLDRIDNNGDYVIGNLRWATAHEQAMNRSSPGILIGREVSY